MVDVISNQVSDFISAFPRFSGIISNNQQRLTTLELRRFATEKLRQKSIIKEQEKQVRSLLLFLNLNLTLFLRN